MTTNNTCPHCGAEMVDGKCPNGRECRVCVGTGQIMKILTNGSSGWAWVTCRKCNGTGVVCPVCGGEGGDDGR